MVRIAEVWPLSALPAHSSALTKPVGVDATTLALGREQGSDALGLGGRAREVTLQQGTSEGTQLECLLLRLDTLGHALEAEAVRQAGDRGDDGAVLRVHRHALHERTVDLDHVDRELAHVAERREPGAEVVEREPHAEQLHRTQPCPRGDRVEQQRSLGQLEAEQRRAQPRRRRGRTPPSSGSRARPADERTR